MCIVSTGQTSTARQNVLLPALGLDGSAVSRITKITDLTDFALAISNSVPSILIFKARAADGPQQRSGADCRRPASVGRVLLWWVVAAGIPFAWRIVGCACHHAFRTLLRRGPPRRSTACIPLLGRKGAAATDGGARATRFARGGSEEGEEAEEKENLSTAATSGCGRPGGTRRAWPCIGRACLLFS